MTEPERNPPTAADRDEREIATAYHEAGHAVIALALGRPLHRVTIVPGKTHSGVETLGQCQVKKGRFRPSKDELEDEMIILFAGMVAEARYTKRYCESGAAQDLRAIRRFALSRAGGERQVARLERRMLDKTEYLLSDTNYWLAVQRIVAQLLEFNTISGRAARHIFDEVTRT